MKQKKLIKRQISAIIIICLFVCCINLIPVHAATPQGIQNESQLRDAFFNGGQYQLSEDIHLDQPVLLSNLSADGIFSSADITIDFNGHTIFSELTALEIRSYGAENGGNITFLDSHGGGGIQTFNVNSIPIKIGDDKNDCYTKSLTLNAGTYTGIEYALYIAEGALCNVIINSGFFTYNGGHDAPIYGPCTINGSYMLSPDGRTLAIGDQTSDEESTTCEPTTETTDPHTTTSAHTSAPQRQDAKLYTSTALPGASYTVTIPATIPIPALERAEESDKDKNSRTDFTISITDIKNFFHEKSVVVTLDSNFTLMNTENSEDSLNYIIMQGEAIYNNQTEFGRLNEDNTQLTGAIVVDKSTIRKNGNYQGNIMFHIALLPGL